MEVILSFGQVHVVHECTILDLEALLNIFDPSHAKPLEVFPSKKINDTVPDPLSIFQAF
jgi:hypothetical protein